jgi:hypothetical protein
MGAWACNVQHEAVPRAPPRLRPVGGSVVWSSFIFRDAWEAYKAAIPVDERSDFIGAYYKRLTSDDPNERAKAAAVSARTRLRTVRCAESCRELPVPRAADA